MDGRTCGNRGGTAPSCGNGPGREGEEGGAEAARIEEERLRRLVADFSAALLEKLLASEAKYGWKGGWAETGWEEDLRRDLLRHVAKGDPRDVAAYCAFAWSHSWPTAKADPDPEGAGCV